MYDVDYDRKVTTLLSILSVIFFVNDLHFIFPKLKNAKTKCLSVLAFHHFLVTFVSFGFLYSDKRKLTTILTFQVFLLMFWRTNENRCILTEAVNEYCEFPKDELFNDFYNVFYLKKPENKKYVIAIQAVGTFILFTKLLKGMSGTCR